MISSSPRHARFGSNCISKDRDPFVFSRSRWKKERNSFFDLLFIPQLARLENNRLINSSLHNSPRSPQQINHYLQPILRNAVIRAEPNEAEAEPESEAEPEPELAPYPEVLRTRLGGGFYA